MVAPRLGSTVGVMVRGEAVIGILVQRDRRRTDHPAQLQVVTSPLGRSGRVETLIFPEDGSIPIATLSQPGDDAWVVLYNDDTVPTIRAIADDEPGAMAWLAEHRPDWERHGDIRPVRYADIATL